MQLRKEVLEQMKRNRLSSGRVFEAVAEFSPYTTTSDTGTAEQLLWFRIPIQIQHMFPRIVTFIDTDGKVYLDFPQAGDDFDQLEGVKRK